MPVPPYLAPQTPSPGTAPKTPPRAGLKKENVVTFVVVFAILSGLVLMFSLIGSSPDTPEAREMSEATTSPAVLQGKNVVSSFFTFDFSHSRSFFAPPQGFSHMFAVTPPTQRPRTSTASGTSLSGGRVEEIRRPLTLEEQEVEFLKQLEGVYGETEVTKEHLDLLRIAPRSSPLRGKLWISSVNRSSNATAEYVVLNSANTLGRDTPLSGITLKSIPSGQTVQIGKGVALPFANSVNESTSIAIQPGQRVVVVTGRSPLGYSFQINKCTGYFEQFQNFVPALPQACPLLGHLERPLPPNQLSDTCLDYIERFPRCHILVNVGRISDDRTYDCVKFIEDNTGYQHCVDVHKNDPDFRGREWRVFLNWTHPLWKSRREIIWLLDQDGLFISQYSY